MALPHTQYFALALALGLLACEPEDKDTGPTDTGEPADTDCVPTDEIPYDGIDQDCDGADLIDVDGDGFDAVEAGGTDCLDEDPDSFPGADEVPYDGIDQDCDGADLTDIDGDGFDAVDAGGTDCLDEDPEAFPGADEVPYDGIDQDCDGVDLTDVDEDGHDAVVAGGDDCDDADPDVSPSAPELCNEVDDDCDGRVDVMVAGSTHVTIQEAMDAACEADDEVLVAAGTYYENIDWDPERPISLSSIDGPELTVVDGSTCANGPEACSVFSLVEVDGEVNLSGLTITGGQGSDAFHWGLVDGPGGRIYGGGVYVYATAVNVDNCIVEANQAGTASIDGRGGGLYAGAGQNTHDGEYLTVTDSWIRDNEVTISYGGGIAVYRAGLILRDTVVETNAAVDVGGGVALVYSIDTPTSYYFTNEFTDNTFLTNEARDGGGLYVAVSTIDDFSGNLFQENNAGNVGGGLCNAGTSELDMGLNTWIDNTPDDWCEF